MRVSSFLPDVLKHGKLERTTTVIRPTMKHLVEVLGVL
jgi:hypothetical protein